MRMEELQILRGVIRLDTEASSDELLGNYTQLMAKKLAFSPEVADVLNFVSEYYKSTSGFPQYREVEDHFRTKNNFNLVRNLETLKKVQRPDEQQFTYNLKKYAQDYETDLVRKAMEETLNYISENRPKISINESLAEQALSKLNDQVASLYSRSHGNVFTSGNVADYYANFKLKMEESMYDNQSQVIPSGVSIIDQHISGIAKGNLAFLIGYAGSFKTGACMNWCMEAIRLGYNVLYVSMENSAIELTNQILSCHASDADLFGHLGIPTPSHTDIGDGNVTEAQQELIDTAYQDYMIRQQNGEYGQFFVHQPEVAEVTLSYVRNITNFFNAKCGNELDMLVIDAPYLMTPELYKSDFRAALNQIIRSLKLFAQSFNKGEGLAVLCPHQINRDGHDRALKNKDFIYDHKCIADLNEIEKSADLAMTVFSDNEDLRVTNQVLVQFLKSRHHGVPKYQNFPIYANLATRRWGNLNLDSSGNYEDQFDFSLEETFLGEG